MIRISMDLGNIPSQSELVQEIQHVSIDQLVTIFNENDISEIQL